MLRFVALSRVSSREQEREGFSLDIQDEALNLAAESKGGMIVMHFRIAETASRTDERTTFRELLSYCRKNAEKLDGVLFYKVDRATRNLKDFVALEEIEDRYKVPLYFVTQPTENTPAGRMMRRTLATMAAFTTEQQSLDVRDGIAKRVEEGWPTGLAPYGYTNIRIDKRGIVVIDEENGPKIQRIFELYAYHGATLDDLSRRLFDEGIFYRPSQPKFPRTSLHQFLTNRIYIGEIKHKGEWYPGKQSPLVTRETWDRVQVLLGNQVYRSHELTYASGLISCGHCDHFVTGECKTKETKSGPKDYVYYRCSKYSRKDHPKVRLTESDLDAQVLGLFDQLRIDDEKVSDWFMRILRARTREQQEESEQEIAALQRQFTETQKLLDRLVNLRLHDEIDEQTFAGKQTELRDQKAALKLKLEVADRSHDENADIAIKAFELSQCLRSKWVTADYSAKRRILEILCLNFSLIDATLVPTWRKPFDVLAEGLEIKNSRGDRI